MGHNILIAIPAYNEELTIGSVVALSKKHGDVLVVDDGSKDKTFEIAPSVWRSKDETGNHHTCI
ncbi:glycosyltransferase [Thermococcus sp. GR7]|uniref:glycosyltransferase n=2 Tax=Thermococcus TaxID=2263 RepID=UPI001430CF36|nr:glycosyltransferase [Thermococcus sp. GR4]NJE45905.1 glycosyltransferase [Thermococcus sp. GR7]NJE78796.1 glycosyltransferase [Thermococcus sp. GR4]NJF22100.1 glycosyltransferase [Thermococcus sp. GR5]